MARRWKGAEVDAERAIIALAGVAWDDGVINGVTRGRFTRGTDRVELEVCPGTDYATDTPRRTFKIGATLYDAQFALSKVGEKHRTIKVQQLGDRGPAKAVAIELAAALLVERANGIL